MQPAGCPEQKVGSFSLVCCCERIPWFFFDAGCSLFSGTNFPFNFGLLGRKPICSKRNCRDCARCLMDRFYTYSVCTTSPQLFGISPDRFVGRFSVNPWDDRNSLLAWSLSSFSVFSVHFTPVLSLSFLPPLLLLLSFSSLEHSNVMQPTAAHILLSPLPPILMHYSLLLFDSWVGVAVLGILLLSPIPPAVVPPLVQSRKVLCIDVRTFFLDT